jgi:hypothetical protein
MRIACSSLVVFNVFALFMHAKYPEQECYWGEVGLLLHLFLSYIGMAGLALSRT